MTTLSTFAELPSDALLVETVRLAAQERLATGRLIAALSEIDARTLYLGEGCSSLFVYCTRVLHLSEHAAYSRIEAARAVRRFPAILDRLTDGALTLTSVILLAPHLTDDNCAAVLDAARHKSKRDVEVQVAALRPRPAVAASIRKLPERPIVTPSVATAPISQPDDPVRRATPVVPTARPPVVQPLAPEQYKIQFTVSRGTHDTLRRVQDLLRHAIPDGDPAKIFDRALDLLLKEVEKMKCAAAVTPRAAERASRPGTRHIAAGVKRAVWRRDGGQCAFAGHNGRCGERGFLEFHHRQPFAAGGPATVENLELRCRAHNGYEADLFFRPWTVRERRSESEDGPWS